MNTKHTYNEKVQRLITEGKLHPSNLAVVNVQQDARYPFRHGGVYICDSEVEVQRSLGNDPRDKTAD